MLVACGAPERGAKPPTDAGAEDTGSGNGGGGQDTGPDEDTGPGTDTGPEQDVADMDVSGGDTVEADTSEDVVVVEPISFAEEIHDLFPANCTGGGCHNTGAGGFTISGSVDADYQAVLGVITPFDSAGSKLLKKASATSSHQGGPIWPTDSEEYQLVAEWIDGGAEP